MAWIRLALRRLRDDRTATAGLAVLVLVTALIVALAPRVVARLADDAVRSEVATATPARRSLQLMERLVLPAGPATDPLQAVRAAGLDVESTFPRPVRSLIADRSLVVESGRFRVNKATTDPAFVRLRVMEGIESHLRYVAGVPPTAAVTTRNDVGPEKLSGVPVYEAGVSTATAARLGLAVGETLELVGDPGDPLVGRIGGDLYSYVTLTGIYDVTDPDGAYWLDDPTPVHVVVRALSSETQLLDASLVLAAGTYGALARNTEATGRVLGVDWRSFLAVERLTDRTLDATITGFRRLQVRYPSANITPSSQVALRTGMLPLLEAHRGQWNAAESIVSVIALGPALVAIATLALIAVLAAARRRSTMALARSRGASGTQVVVPVAIEGLVIAAPAAVLAVVAAVLLVPAGSGRVSAGLAAAIVGVAVAIVVATVASVVRGQGAARRIGGRIAGRVSARRLVLEALLVVLAVGAAVLLRDRGVGAVVAANGGKGFDPLIAAVPALAGIAAGIVVTRVYPVPLAGIAWLAARGRGLVGMLAARRAGEGGASSAVLLVLLATATVGAFAMTALDNLDRGADIAAWQEVGGDYRLQQPSGPLPRGLEPASLPGVAAASGVFSASIPVAMTGPQAIVVMPQAAALEAALAGTPAEPRFPQGFATTARGPIPAIISRSLAESPRGVRPGDTFTLSIEGYNLTYRAVEVRDAFPGVPLGRHFVVIAREAFIAQAPPARVVPVYAILRASPSAADPLRAAIAAISPAVHVTSASETAAAFRDQPVTNVVRSLVLLAALVTAAYAALGVAAALALAGLSRTQEVAHLRTLGLTSRQTVLLTVAEHGPITIAAFVLGGLLGVVMFVMLRPALGLDALVGSPVDVPFALQPVPVIVILAAMTLVLGAGLLLGVVLQRRVAPTAAIRGGFE